MVAELGRIVWEPHTHTRRDCALSLSLKKLIDLNSKSGFAFKEVERLVGGQQAVAGEISSH